jgi:hypothetical protein
MSIQDDVKVGAVVEEGRGGGMSRNVGLGLFSFTYQTAPPGKQALARSHLPVYPVVVENRVPTRIIHLTLRHPRTVNKGYQSYNVDCDWAQL